MFAVKRFKKAFAAAMSAAMAVSALTAVSAGVSADWSRTAEGYVYRDVISGKNSPDGRPSAAADTISTSRERL